MSEYYNQETITNLPTTPSQQTNTTSQTMSQSTQTNIPNSSSNTSSFRNKLLLFLFSSPKITMISSATAFAIGMSSKDLISSFIHHVVKPLIIYFFVFFKINNYINIDNLISSSSNSLNVSNFLSALFTFILLIIIAYYITTYTTMRYDSITSTRS
jgi:large-conductance mechanosensitive channel